MRHGKDETLLSEGNYIFNYVDGDRIKKFGTWVSADVETVPRTLLYLEWSEPTYRYAVLLPDGGGVPPHYDTKWSVKEAIFTCALYLWSIMS